MKKNNIILAVLGIIAVLGVISAVPKNNTEDKPASPDPASGQRRSDTDNMPASAAPAEKVEVFLFHRTQRCATCVAIGKLSGQAVEEEFAGEVASGKVVFREINIDEPQNKALAGKFQASGSSLFINAVRDGKDNIREDMEVWRLTGDPEAFKKHIAGKLNVLLGKQ